MSGLAGSFCMDSSPVCDGEFQLVDAHRSYLELGDFGVGVGGIDGEPVGRGFGEVERDKDHARLHPLGDEGGQFDMAAAGW